MEFLEVAHALMGVEEVVPNFAMRIGEDSITLILPVGDKIADMFQMAREMFSE